MYFKDELVRIKKEMAVRHTDLEKELGSMPEGELYIRSGSDAKDYYVRIRKGGNRKKEHRIGIKRNTEMMGLMLRKRYAAGALPILENNISLIDRIIDRYVPADEDSVMSKFFSDNPELEKYFYHSRDFLKEWAESYESNGDYIGEHLTSTAADGSMRRSKGEILIGAKLDHYNVPYRYEAKAHPDLPYIPDFTIRRPRDGKFIYWEHLGMVNDREYMEGNRRKFDAYEEVGIVPWDNLIVTYDQREGGINEKLIDAMIHGWLL